MNGTRIFRRAGPLAACAMAVALMLVPAATPAAGAPYTDPAGDNGAGGDVTGVAVATDKSSGQIVFRITGTNLSTSSDQLTMLNIDSDANPLTGDIQSGGSDYWFGIDNNSYGFQHWNGSDWVDTSYSTVSISGGGSGLLVSVNRSELGNTSDFNFSVETVQMTGGDKFNPGDIAPNDGMYNYSLDAGGPLIEGVDVQTTPSAGPRAGRAFTVAPSNLKLPPTMSLSNAAVLPDSYTCSAALKGKALRGSGTGGCTFKLAKAARRKTLKVALTVHYEGATKTVPLVFRVA
jgi:hypothetical protein